MKNEKMFELVDLAEDELLLEAAQQRPRIKHSRRFPAAMIAAAAAAAMAVTAGAAVASSKLTHKDAVNYYYSDSMTEEIESGGFAVGEVTENEHVRMTLENLIVDENYATGVVNVEFLDDIGRNAFREDIIPQAFMIDDNGNILYSKKERYNAILGLLGQTNNQTENSGAYFLNIYLKDAFSAEPTVLPDKVNVIFSDYDEYDKKTVDELTIPDALKGLSLTVSTTPNVQTARFKADSGNEAVLSQANFDFVYDARNYTSTNDREIPDTITLNYTDGTVVELRYYSAQDDNDFLPGAASTSDTFCHMSGDFCNMISLDGIESVEFAGEIYKVH